nr:iga fc receptor [Quercus suber]
MASNKFFILAFFVVFNVLSSINLSLAARNLLQTTTPSIPTVPVVPTLPKPTPLPPLPTLPLPTTIPSLPNLPTIPSIPQFNFPQIPNIPSLPTIPTTIPSIPFFSPPPSRGFQASNAWTDRVFPGGFLVEPDEIACCVWVPPELAVSATLVPCLNRASEAEEEGGAGDEGP